MENLLEEKFYDRHLRVYLAEDLVLALEPYSGVAVIRTTTNCGTTTP